MTTSSIPMASDRAVNARQRLRVIPPPAPSDRCLTCGGSSTYVILLYDIFGNDVTREIPTGYVPLCEECRRTGRWRAWGYFECGDCGKVMKKDRTWENYLLDSEEGHFCIPCALKRYMRDDGNWFTKVPREADPDDESFPGYLYDAPHYVPKESLFWQPDLVCVGKAEFDQDDGQQISGEPMRDIIREALEARPRYLILIDAIHDDIASYGIYIERELGEKVAAS
jgi:hypothetical protein